MGSHPINLLIRFLLEIAALLALGIWGWGQSENWFRYILALGIPIMAATIWGIFAVPDDPSRSGSAPIAIPGILRLLVELSIFAMAVWTTYELKYARLSWIFGIIILIHYVFSYDRVFWLLKQYTYRK